MMLGKFESIQVNSSSNLSPFRLRCTQIFLLGAECGFDPPKSTPLVLSRETRRHLLQVGKAAQRSVSPTQWLPLKRGTLILVPPFSQGG